MRVIVACLPALGHLYPVMPLAEALRASGHEVVLATGAEPAGRLAAQGWATEVVAPTTRDAAREVVRQGLDPHELPPAQRWRFGAELFSGALAAAVADELAPVLARRRPDLVVYDEMNLGAALAAGFAGLPAVRHGLGPWLPDPMREYLLDALVRHWRRAARTPPDEGGLLGRLHLDVWPPVLPGPQAWPPLPRTPLRPVPWNEPGLALPDLLREPRPRPVAYLTLGTVSPAVVPVLRTVVEGLAGLDVDILAAVGPALDPGCLGPLPPGVRLAAFVPGAEVLARADLVVHHGGSGTTLGALAAARPQLILPQLAHDQFLTAEAVVAAGVGCALRPEQVSVEAVAAAASQLLAPGEHRQRAQDLARRIGELPGPAAVVPQLAALTG